MDHLKYIFTYKRDLIYSAIYVIFLGLGLYLRLRGLPLEMFFRGDTGQDLMFGLRIIRGEFYPLVGPILSLNGFFTPPTYYYFLAAILGIFKTEINIIYFYVFMNITSGILIALFVKKRVNNIVALFFFIFYMVSYYSVNQSHSIWQPFPVTFFVAIALWLISTINNKSSIWLILLSIIFFCLAITIYFAATILIPFIIFQLYNAFRIKGLKTHVLALTLVSFFSILFFFYFPWLLNEIHNNFPTYRSIISPLSNGPGGYDSHFVLYDSLSGLLSRIVQPITIIFTLANQTWWEPRRQMFVNIIFFVPLTIIALRLLSNSEARKSFKLFLDSTGLIYIFLGFVPLVFYQSEIQFHRLLPLLPFIYLILAYMVNFALASRSMMLRLTSILLFTSIVIPIFSYTVPYFIGGHLQTYKEVGALYKYLKKDIKNRDEVLNKYDFRIYTSKQENYFEVQPLWFFLYKNDNYPINFNYYGNDTDRPAMASRSHKYAYLICFTSPGFDDEACKKLFMPYYQDATIIDRTMLNPYTIYLVEANSNTL